MKRFLTFALMLSAAACGVESSMPAYDGVLGTPTPRKARVTVTPALDFSDASARVGEHFVVDEVVVNLSDVRILGEDPSIPAGGYPLLSEPTLVYAEGSGEVGVELPFPPSFLEHEGLAIYLRSDPSGDLEGASIVVSGRWVQDDGDGMSESAATTGVVDPDGEPVRPESRDGVVDPDGEPVRPGDRDGVVDPDGEPVRPGDRDGVVDPDGEPVDCLEVGCGQQQHALTEGTPLVLREVGVVELVVSIDQRSRFNLVFGIPAARWIDDATSDQIVDEVVQASSSDANATPEPVTITAAGDGSLVSGQAEPSGAQGPQGRRQLSDRPAGGYYLADGLPIEDAITRGPGL